MQPQADAIAVLGARHGLFFDPSKHQANILRYSYYPGRPICLEAGVRVLGRSIVFPMAMDRGEEFNFVDQEMSPTSMTLVGLDPHTALKATLVIRTPFRPRDDDFSTTPVITFELSVERLPGGFRWYGNPKEPVEGEVFIRITGPEVGIEPHGSDAHRLTHDCVVNSWSYTDKTWEGNAHRSRRVASEDRLVWFGDAGGRRMHDGANLPFTLAHGQSGPTLRMAWCAHGGPVLEVLGEACSFRYARNFADVDAVADWARNNFDEISENSARVDPLLAPAQLSVAQQRLLSQTLHSWLINTWWVDRPGNKGDWFSVWEGSCHFHSTVDVEYTQGPFYLAVWPELLEKELNQWPEFRLPGERMLGHAGRGTAYLAHDMGSDGACNKPIYGHDMPVEEGTNYVILAYALWKRTGLDSFLTRHAELVREICDFCIACDSTGNGLPDQGCANTIDDAAPAIQYGKEQVYLAVKSMVTLMTGAEILNNYKPGTDVSRYTETAEKIRSELEGRGFADDHYVVVMDASAEGVVDGWTGKEYEGGELPGWDATHIYTVNGLALLDMIGFRSGLDDSRLLLDMQMGVARAMTRFGCSHSDYSPEDLGASVPGLAVPAQKTGWISMNMLRDIAAGYRGLDLSTLADRYWDWQATTNTQECCIFFETFHGNNLNYYPRGVAIFGLCDSLGRVVIDGQKKTVDVDPLPAGVGLPVLLLADWKKGGAPLIQQGGIAGLPKGWKSV